MKMMMYLIEESNVERKSKLVAETDLLGELVTEFAGCSSRVGQQRLCVTVHKRNW